MASINVHRGPLGTSCVPLRDVPQVTAVLHAYLLYTVVSFIIKVGEVPVSTLLVLCII